MVEFLVAENRLSRDDAYVLSSLAADLHMTQAVDQTQRRARDDREGCSSSVTCHRAASRLTFESQSGEPPASRTTRCRVCTELYTCRNRSSTSHLEPRAAEETLDAV